MVSIKWCKKQSKGISLIDKKPHLSKAYMKEAYDSLKVCLNSTGKWKVITGYYACYNAFYSILMHCGIKCEIHDCTIELMKFFDFSISEIKFLEKLKRDRVHGQYYLKDVELENVSKVKSFIIKCEEILSKINESDVKKIRGELNE